MSDRSSVDRTAQAREGAQEGAREWLRMLENVAQQIQRQQQTSQQMTQELMNTYAQLLNAPGSYLSGQAQQQRQTFQQTAQQWMEQAQQQQQTFRQTAQQQQQAFQQMVQESLNTYSQLLNIPVSYAQKGLQEAQYPIEGYDELSAEQISNRLDNLSTEELRLVRDYEERNRNRSTILQELDRKIRGGA